MSTHELVHQLTAFVSDEISCFQAPNGMTGCNLPITYPDGDYVTVYVGRREGVWEVTDRGEGHMVVLGKRTPDMKDFSKRAQAICQSLGVVFANGRVLSAAKDESLTAQIWAVGRAATRIAEYATFWKPQKIDRLPAVTEPSFVDEVATELGTRRVELGRDVPVVGASGHQHTATLYVPTRKAVVEPLEPTARFARVSGTYAKFGDLAKTNGYARYAVIDDRTAPPMAETERLLSQVGTVVEWSARQPWLVELMRG